MCTCVRSGNCSLQSIANDLGIIDIPYEREFTTMPEWTEGFPLVRNYEKCIKCMRCIQVCDKIQDCIFGIYPIRVQGQTVDVSYNRRLKKRLCPYVVSVSPIVLLVH